MKKRELFNLMQAIKDIDRYRKDETTLSFIHPDLRFAFWGSESDRNMDLMIDIFDDNNRTTGDIYTLSFNEERLNMFLYLLETQIND